MTRRWDPWNTDRELARWTDRRDLLRVQAEYMPEMALATAAALLACAVVIGLLRLLKFIEGKCEYPGRVRDFARTSPTRKEKPAEAEGGKPGPGSQSIDRKRTRNERRS